MASHASSVLSFSASAALTGKRVFPTVSLFWPHAYPCVSPSVLVRTSRSCRQLMNGSGWMGGGGGAEGEALRAGVEHRAYGQFILASKTNALTNSIYL